DQPFGSDPSLAFDTRSNLYYSYIVVFFGNGSGVNGTEMAVARSTDGGRTYPSVTYFNFETGSSRFNDKPMIAADTNAKSPFRDNVYVAWMLRWAEAAAAECAWAGRPTTPRAFRSTAPTIPRALARRSGSCPSWLRRARCS